MAGGFFTQKLLISDCVDICSILAYMFGFGVLLENISVISTFIGL